MVEAPEPPHQHHAKTGLPWFDLIMPLAVLFISLASLLTSLESERSMRALVEQNRRLVTAQSTPLLMLDTGNEDKGRPVLDLTISNVGTGPAQISWFRVVDSQGQSYVGGDLTERMEKLGSTSEITSLPISATMMRSGDQREVFAWPKPTGSAAAVAAWNTLERARFQLRASACYCSMFEECWTTEFHNSRPKPVASCS